MYTIEQIKQECREALEEIEKPFEMPTGYVGKSAVKGEYYRCGYMAGRHPFKYIAPRAAKAWLAVIEHAEFVKSDDPVVVNGILDVLCESWEDSK